MNTLISHIQIFFIICALCLSSMTAAQSPVTEEKTAAEKTEAAKLDTEKLEAEKLDAGKADAELPAPAAEVNRIAPSTTGHPEKMVQNATINLQTTVTGNQEQPRVLYILPWQSPAPEDVDFESFSNAQRVVYGHVEREELRRELESAGE
jgi:hypothetical protein